MLVSCPACSKEYNLKPEHFSSPTRKVRCGDCQHCWVVSRPVPVNHNIAGQAGKSTSQEAEDQPAGHTSRQNQTDGSNRLFEFRRPQEQNPTTAFSKSSDLESEQDNFLANTDEVFNEDFASDASKASKSKRKLSVDWILLALATILLAVGLLIKTGLLGDFNKLLSQWTDLSLEKSNTAMDISKVSYKLVKKDNGSQVIVGATIRNMAKNVQNIPKLNIIVWDECPSTDGFSTRRCSINSWTHEVSNQRIDPGKDFSFRVLFPYKGNRIKGAEVKLIN